MPALRYFDLDLWPIVRSRRHVLDFSHHEEAVDDAAEDNVLLVEEVALGARDEKLKGVRTSWEMFRMRGRMFKMDSE